MKSSLTVLFWLFSLTFLLAQTRSDYQSFFYQTVPSFYKKNKKTGENCINAPHNRHFSGICNNMSETNWGASDVFFGYKMTPVYGQNNGMTGENRPSARVISNLVCHQAEGENLESQRGLSSMVYTFFQFIDHNITATTEGHTEYEPIPVPMNDPYFDPNGTGNQTIPFMRSMKVMDENGMARQMNQLSSWVDGAGIYGVNEARAAWLRTFSGGKLKTSANNLLPCNTISGDCNDAIDTLAPFMVGNENHCGAYQRVFVAGDVRANEQPGLLSLHTLFVREHNLVCDELAAAGMADDEKIYQKARRIVIGKLQTIVYQELLPALGIRLDDYRGYDERLKPTIYNIFSTAAFRLGHTMVTEKLSILDANCQPITANTGCGAADNDCSCTNFNTNFVGEVGLKDAFFHPSLVSNVGIAPILKGLTTQTQQEIDIKVISGLRNFLFGAPGNGGLDLAALNIQRGRDHGLPDYNSIRQHFTGSSAATFAEITNDATVQNALSTAYNGDINNIDAFVGLLAEAHLPNASVGATLHAILKDQFTRLREGDRYFYKIDPMLSPNERAIIQNTVLADLFKRNTTLINVPMNVFFARNCAAENDILVSSEDVSAYPSETVTIPIVVENFKNAYEIAFTIAWDSSELFFQNAQNTVFQNANWTLTPQGNRLEARWSSFQNVGKTLDNGSTILELEFEVLTTSETNYSLSFSNLNAASVAGIPPNFGVPLQARSGNIHIKTRPNYFSISGSVTTPFGVPMPDLEVSFLKDNQLSSYYYIPSGQTMFKKGVVFAGTDYDFSVKTTALECPFYHQLSVLDAVLLEAHLLNDRPFEQPYSFLSADFDENDSLSFDDLQMLDAALLRQFIQFPIDNFRFFSTEQYPTLDAPFSIIKKRKHADIEAFLYAQNFMGVPKGKIASMDDFQKEILPTNSNPRLIENAVLKNERIEIPILTDDLGRIKGFQMTLNWNANVLEYINFRTSISDLTNDNLDIKNLENGQIAVIWHSDAAVVFNANDTLMVLQFDVIGNHQATSLIHVNDEIKPVLFVTEDFKILEPRFDSYRIRVIENLATSDNPFQLTVFPNPTRSFFQVQFQLDEPSQVVRMKFYNSIGKPLLNFEKTYNAGLQEISLTNLDFPTGIYFLQFEVDGVVVTEKVYIK